MCLCVCARVCAGVRQFVDTVVCCYLQTDSTIRGITFFYPDVQPDAVPVPYPYTIYFNPGNNQAVIDVELLNVFNGIYVSYAHGPQQHPAVINVGWHMRRLCKLRGTSSVASKASPPTSASTLTARTTLVASKTCIGTRGTSHRHACRCVPLRVYHACRYVVT